MERQMKNFQALFFSHDNLIFIIFFTKQINLQVFLNALKSALIRKLS